MTIPRQLGPETGPARALPDYSRSSATVERMVAALEDRTRAPGRRPSRRVRALLPAHATRDVLVRAVVAAVLLGGGVIPVVVGALLLLGLEDGRAPGLALLQVLLGLAGLALLLGLAGLRFGVVALAAARSRVEISEDALFVQGALRSRRVAWADVEAVESRVLHPVHGLTAALRLQDGTRVLMPAFDRGVWGYSRPAGEDIRTLRTELHRRRSGRNAGRPAWKP